MAASVIASVGSHSIHAQHGGIVSHDAEPAKGVAARLGNPG
jgi:hypothetical protein